MIAGAIVEKVSGMPLMQLLRQRVFTPLQMKSVTNTDANKLPPTDPGGYFRYALGPLHPAPKEGHGWMFAAGELAMTAEDLAKWDISMMDQTVLKPASYREMETEIRAEERRGDALRIGCLRHEQQRASGAGARRRGIGICGRKHRVAGRQDCGGRADEPGRVRGG